MRIALYLVWLVSSSASMVLVVGEGEARARTALDEESEPEAQERVGLEPADADSAEEPSLEPREASAFPVTPGLLGPGRAAPLVYVGAEGGWDGARRGPVMETNVETSLAGPVSFRAGAAVNPSDGRASPLFALKVDLLNQRRHGLGGALFAGYRGQGFNLVPAVEFGIAMGRRSERVTLVSSLAYGQGLERGERYGDVRAAALLRVHRRLNLDVGLDGRARFDLELDADEPAGEAALDGVAGPLVVWGLGRFALSGQAGVAVVAPRAGAVTHVGATARLGLGAAF